MCAMVLYLCLCIFFSCQFLLIPLAKDTLLSGECCVSIGLKFYLYILFTSIAYRLATSALQLLLILHFVLWLFLIASTSLMKVSGTFFIVITEHWHSMWIV